MAFRFDISGSVGGNAEAMLSRQLSKAARLLRAGLEDADKVGPGIHGARKCLKRSRALLKLIRPGLKRSRAKRFNAALRGCGRALGGERDRAVGLETLAWLSARPGAVPSTLQTAIRKLYLAPDERGPIDQSRATVAVRETLMEALEQTEALRSQHVPALNLEKVDERHVAAAYAATYADGRNRYFAIDVLTADDEDVHDLRKPVQHHWRQTSLLADLWPDEQSLRLETARRVSKALGIDHDLSLLSERVDEGLHVQRLSSAKLKFLDHCREMQVQLRHEADPWLRRLYAMPPDVWTETVDHWWQSARDELAQSAIGDSPLVPARGTTLPQL